MDIWAKKEACINFTCTSLSSMDCDPEEKREPHSIFLKWAVIFISKGWKVC